MSELPSNDGKAYTILLISSDSPDRRAMCAGLIQDGYRLIEADNGSEAIALASARPPDLVLVDSDISASDLVLLVSRLRGCLSVPLIVVSRLVDDARKIAIFDAGADDYLARPIAIPELQARLRVAVRRLNRQTAHEKNAAVVSIGDLHIKRTSRQVFVADNEIRLTPTEWRLIDLLAAHADRPLTHSFLLNSIWGPNFADDVQYLRVFVAALRRKIEPNPHCPQYIITEQGTGYRLSSSKTLTSMPHNRVIASP